MRVKSILISAAPHTQGITALRLLTHSVQCLLGAACLSANTHTHMHDMRSAHILALSNPTHRYVLDDMQPSDEANAFFLVDVDSLETDTVPRTRKSDPRITVTS